MRVDFSRHNEEVREVWRTFAAGHPARVPVLFPCDARMVLLDPSLNRRGWSVRSYMEDPDVLWEVQLALHRWVRFAVPQDREMGYPTAWTVEVRFFGVEEAAWLGCPLRYPHGETPSVEPILRDRKERLHELEVPDPLHGLEFHERLEERRRREEFEGRPVGPVKGPTATSGPFTVACALRGAEELCRDLTEDPDYARELLGFVTTALIARLRAWCGEEWSFADDAIDMLSPETYREFVLPCHRRMVAALSEGRPVRIHLCGRVRQHLMVLRRDLDVRTFELGFPIDLGRARAELGPEATLAGNLNPLLLKDGTPTALVGAVADLCGSGATTGGRFILQTGGDVAPGTPCANFGIVYEAARRLMRYADSR